jgi:hypothetical protein
MTGKDAAYYALAAILVLATVPLYRYIIERGRAADSQPNSVPAVTQTRTYVIPDPERVRLEASAQPPLDRSLPPHRMPDLLTNEEQCFNGQIIRVSRQGLLHETNPDETPARCKDRERLR